MLTKGPVNFTSISTSFKLVLYILYILYIIYHYFIVQKKNKWNNEVWNLNFYRKPKGFQLLSTKTLNKQEILGSKTSF